MLTRLRHRVQGQEGFTLIELLVVILIIGILAAVAIPAFLNQKGKANDANVKSDIDTAQTAEETYFTSNQAYTPTAANLTAIEPALTQAFVSSTAATNPGDGMTLVTPAAAIDGYTLPSSPTASTSNSYYISATSKSGVTFVLVHSPDGTLSRVCNIPAGTNASGCNPTSGTSGNGTW
jgi:type IV pilus assembly protein PilA